MDNEDNEMTCVSCGDDISEPIIIDEHNYCDDCAISCVSCSAIVTRDDSLGGEYCTDCGFICEFCENSYHTDDSYSVGNSLWCSDCRGDHAFYCERCGETYPDDNGSCYVQGNTYCDDCASNISYYCDDCDDYFFDEDPCECRDSEDDENSTGCRCRARSGEWIHDYSCKPTLTFYGSDKPNALYMGFELETQIHGDYRNAGLYASGALAGHAILKSDSSIGRDGFEIVTQPTTHAYYRENSDTLWSVIDKLRTDYEARSWDTDTCGLHIHVSRAGFSSGAHTHRFLAFIYKNAEMMMKFAGRKTQYARFNDVWRFDEYDRPYLSLKHKLDPHAPTERYSAVNTQNRDTLELRFFRGTMNPKGVLSALDLTQAIFDYTKNLRISDVNMGALSWEWFCDYVDTNNGLYPDLYERIYRVKDVNISKPIKMNA